MISNKQLAANQRNALKSMGPRTTEGKAVASRNSLKHGLLSSQPVMDDESKEEYEQFREGLLTDLAPQCQLECLLADRIVGSAWRLRRAVRIEREMLQADFDGNCGPPGISSSKSKILGICVGTRLIFDATYGKFSRYEAHIERGLYKALHELQRLQAARSGQAVAAPVAVDVAVSGLGQTN